MADEKQPKITYRVDDMEYDVLKLSEEAQGIYYALLATQSELNTLGKRSIVLKAAITELQGKGYALPDYPDEPMNDDEKAIHFPHDLR